MSHVFTTPLTIRGYECGPGGVVPLPVVLSHLEHCRWQWILHESMGLVELLEAGHFFVVHRATLRFARTYGLGTSLTVRAALRRVGRVKCEVEQDLVRDDGVLLARAHIDAIWLGPTGAMRRVPNQVRTTVTDEPLTSTTPAAILANERSGYLLPAERVFPGTLEPRISRELPDHAEATALLVRPSDCDAHEHVNNASYLRFFEDALGGPCADADVEYRGQARAGDHLQLRSWDHDDQGRRAFALIRGDQVLCRAVLTPR